MNDEIRGILKEIECYQNEDICLIMLSQKENKALLDYITNLQQENESLKEQLEYLRSGEYLNQVKWERDLNENLNQTMSIELINYKSRCEKAIEYIKDTTFFGLRSGKTFMSKYLNDLLSILQNGSDNN